MTQRYLSEFDQWLRGYKEDHPNTEWTQQEGRALLWDQRPEDITRSKFVVNNRQKGYVYYDIDDYSSFIPKKK
jgi:Protein of unknown function (DUF3460)